MDKLDYLIAVGRSIICAPSYLCLLYTKTSYEIELSKLQSNFKEDEFRNFYTKYHMIFYSHVKSTEIVYLLCLFTLTKNYLRFNLFVNIHHFIYLFHCWYITFLKDLDIHYLL